MYLNRRVFVMVCRCFRMWPFCHYVCIISPSDALGRLPCDCDISWVYSLILLPDFVFVLIHACPVYAATVTSIILMKSFSILLGAFVKKYICDNLTGMH